MKLFKIILIYILNLFDLGFTLYFAGLYGNDIELNPIGLWMFDYKPLLFLYKIVIVGILLAVIYMFRKSRKAVVGSWVLLFTFVMVNVYHVFLYIHY
ncbi:MAG: DUF5658 family protein [Eubacteriales bacterium]|jgi:hypothetical protein